MNWFKQRFFKSALSPTGEPPSECPPEWNLTLDDLFAAVNTGQRKTISHCEIEWAKAYERRQIPPAFRFPGQGDLYAANHDQTVSYLTAWAAPFTGSGEATLYQGEQIWIHVDPGETSPIGVYALPVDYKKLAERMVPRTEREDPKFGGFYFYFKTTDLNQHFTLIQTGFTNQP